MKPDIKTILDVYYETRTYKLDNEVKDLIEIEKLNSYQKDSDFYKLIDIFYTLYKESLKGIYKANQKDNKDSLLNSIPLPNDISLTKLSSFSIKGKKIIVPKYFQFLSNDLLTFFTLPIKNFKTSKVTRETFPVTDILSRKEESIKKINWLNYNPVFNNIKIYFSQAKKDYNESEFNLLHVKKFEPQTREEDLLVIPPNLEFALLLNKLSPSDIVCIVAILLISWKRCPEIR